jgi:hypothetical protein
MAAPGLDHCVAVNARLETRSYANMQRDRDGEGSGGCLEQARVDHHSKEERGKKDVGIRVDEDGNLAGRQDSRDLLSLHPPARHTFDGMLPLIDRLRERDRPADGQWPFELGDDELDAGALKA